MAIADITLTGDWPRFTMLLNPKKFDAALRLHVGRCMDKCGYYMRRMIRQEIKRGVPPPKSALSIALAKGGTKPLVGATAALWNSVSKNRIDWDRVFVGVLRGERRHGDDIYNIAMTLHEGASIPVTTRMRNLFAALWRARVKADPSRLRGARARELWAAAPGFEWRRLSPETSTIRIPGRPFIKRALERKAVKDQITRFLEAAVDGAFKQR